jgi:hypothetical protein
MGKLGERRGLPVNHRPNSKISVSTICLFLINILCVSAIGRVISATLDQMVKESELVVIGKVNDIERTTTSLEEYGNEYRAEIGVEQTLKGRSVEKQVFIYYFPRCELEFMIGERCILFIRAWKGKDRIVRGIGGKVKIEDNKAYLLRMVNEDETQELDQFIQKIRNPMKTGERSGGEKK